MNVLLPDAAVHSAAGSQTRTRDGFRSIHASLVQFGT